MVEPISAGTFVTGGRMIWEGIKWIVRSRQAPWSVVNMSATLAPHILPWYSIRLFAPSEKPFAIDLLSARTIRPKALTLCRADGSVQLGMAAGTEAKLLKGLQWVVQEKGATNMPFQRYLFVKLEGLKGEVTVDLELTAQYYDNRRTEALIWVRTNTLDIA
jgi:hypothetical protein